MNTPPARDPWSPDVLGDEWRARTIHLGADEEGPVEATLVRSADGPRHHRAVLYLHGFVDYFFHPHLAATFAARGWDFYALDLRKYGRSLREGQSPNHVRDLVEHAAEIDEAVHIITGEEHHGHLVVLGHSTGGLIGAMWANARPGVLDALVLNSPWLDLNENAFNRTVGTAAIKALSHVAPRTVVGHLAPHYGRALHSGSGGEWDYELTWKPHEGFPVRAGWLASVRRNQDRVARGLDIACPVLVCTSQETGDSKHEHDRLVTTDSVLSVEQILARAPGLGPDVTISQVQGGAHDLALSPEPARTTYLTTVLDWLEDRVTTR